MKISLDIWVDNFSRVEKFLYQKNKNSCLLFVCRLKIDDKRYYPINYDNNTRFLGAIIGLHQLSQTGVVDIDATFKTKTAISSKTKLLNYTAWTDKK